MRHSCAACTADQRSGRTAKNCSCHQDTPRQSQARSSGYSFKEGLTMMAAKDVGVDPYLAADAGEGAKAALNHLRKAGQAKNQTTLAAHIKDAQAELKSISAAKHPKLVNAIQAKLLALQGRGGDTEIAHVTPGEVVIPRNMQTPALMKQIAALAAQRGLNPAQLSVGHSANNINPRTGQREFDASCIPGPYHTCARNGFEPQSTIIMRPAIDPQWGGESGESYSEEQATYDANIARLDQILGNPETATNADLVWALSFAQALAAHHRNLQSLLDKGGGKMTAKVNGRTVNFQQSIADENQSKAEKISTEIRNRLTNGTWTGPVPQLELEKVQVTSPNTFAEDWARTYDPDFSYFPQYDIDSEINKKQICTQYDRTDLSNYFESFNSLDDQIYTYENRLQELEYLSSQASDPTEKANLNQQISGLSVIVGQARGALSILDAKILSLTQKCNSNA